jgi:hypothetical protein
MPRPGEGRELPGLFRFLVAKLETGGTGATGEEPEKPGARLSLQIQEYGTEYGTCILCILGLLVGKSA